MTWSSFDLIFFDLDCFSFELTGFIIIDLLLNFLKFWLILGENEGRELFLIFFNLRDFSKLYLNNFSLGVTK